MAAPIVTSFWSRWNFDGSQIPLTSGGLRVFQGDFSVLNFENIELPCASPFLSFCAVWTTLENYCNILQVWYSWIVYRLSKVFNRIKLICLFASLYFSLHPLVETTLKQRRDKVVSTLFQRCFNFEHRRYINVVQRW